MPSSTPPPSSFTSPSPSLETSHTEAPGGQQRRTQEERSRQTRALLLDATIECLAERGYAGTTAREVATRAGLSRGAQLHHFGTKTQLVTAAVERLFEAHLTELEQALSTPDRDAPSVSNAIDMLWTLLSGKAGHAFMELVWAARTDPELRPAVVDLNDRLDARIDATVRELFPDVPEPWTELGWTAIFAVLQGLSFEKIVREKHDRVDRLIPLLKRAATFAVNAPLGPGPI